jgi:hypothetical protein
MKALAADHLLYFYGRHGDLCGTERMNRGAGGTFCVFDTQLRF